MTRQARVGFVVLLGLTLFVLALFALANRAFLFSDRFIVRSQFNQVAGLQAGGVISAIEAFEKGALVITLALVRARRAVTGVPCPR